LYPLQPCRVKRSSEAALLERLGGRPREASLKRGSRGIAALSTAKPFCGTGAAFGRAPSRAPRGRHAAEPEVSSAIEGGKIAG
jgi:hypothetical protein